MCTNPCHCLICWDCKEQKLQYYDRDVGWGSWVGGGKGLVVLKDQRDFKVHKKKKWRTVKERKEHDKWTRQTLKSGCVERMKKEKKRTGKERKWQTFSLSVRREMKEKEAPAQCKAEQSRAEQYRRKHNSRHRQFNLPNKYLKSRLITVARAKQSPEQSSARHRISPAPALDKITVRSLTRTTHGTSQCYNTQTGYNGINMHLDIGLQ